MEFLFSRLSRPVFVFTLPVLHSQNPLSIRYLGFFVAPAFLGFRYGLEEGGSKQVKRAGSAGARTRGNVSQGQRERNPATMSKPTNTPYLIPKGTLWLTLQQAPDSLQNLSV